MPRLVLHTATGPFEIKPQEKSVWICQCGLSQNLPYCDGSHKACRNEVPGKIYVYGPDRKTIVEVRDEK
ncbi:MAG: CDGSH iron-sulfur domain-containing protein [Phycisphaeraceae bacterium]|nr:CDGSH iron-sulfur domain-containing protein [Phycisphaeraceae bacterium]